MRSEKVPAKRSPQNTIAAIVAAAGREFGERGLEGARMENIARRCGKTTQLIYHYYGFKERQIGRAQVCTPGTNAHLVCRLLIEKKKRQEENHNKYVRQT